MTAWTGGANRIAPRSRQISKRKEAATVNVEIDFASEPGAGMAVTIPFKRKDAAAPSNGADGTKPVRAVQNGTAMRDILMSRLGQPVH